MHTSLELDWVTPTGQEWAGSNQRFQTSRQSWTAGKEAIAAADRQPILSPGWLYPGTVVTGEWTNNFLEKMIIMRAQISQPSGETVARLIHGSYFSLVRRAGGWKLMDIASHLRKSKYFLFP